MANTNLTEIKEKEDCSVAFLPAHTNENGKPKNRLVNYTTILRDHPSFAGRFKYNLMDGCVYVVSMPWDKLEHRYNDYDEAKILDFLSYHYGLDDARKLAQAVKAVARDYMFHPIRDKLEALRGAWDGVDRMADIFPRFLGAERSEYTTAVTKLLFSGAIQRVYHPGCKFDYCIILKGKQGTGKSTLARLLALDDQFFTDQVGDMSSRKVFEDIQGKWFVELGEMLFVKRTKAIEAIKAFITATSDDYRAPYDRYKMRYLRQCVFVGTTNKTEFLPDDKTGNRRFVPLICDQEPILHPLDSEEYTREYIDQCYAQALTEGEKDGYNLVLAPEHEQIAQELNEIATPEDYRIGMIQEWLNNTDEEYVCSRMIWDRVFNDDGIATEPRRAELMEISEIMNTKINGWKPYAGRDGKATSTIKRFRGYGKQRAWEVSTDARGDVDKEFVPVDMIDEPLPFDS